MPVAARTLLMSSWAFRQICKREKTAKRYQKRTQSENRQKSENSIQAITKTNNGHVSFNLWINFTLMPGTCLPRELAMQFAQGPGLWPAKVFEWPALCSLRAMLQ
jgi:hypothetical protein